jgi:hypothetical protein
MKYSLFIATILYSDASKSLELTSTFDMSCSSISLSFLLSSSYTIELIGPL